MTTIASYPQLKREDIHAAISHATRALKEEAASSIHRSSSKTTIALHSSPAPFPHGATSETSQQPYQPPSPTQTPRNGLQEEVPESADVKKPHHRRSHDKYSPDTIPLRSQAPHPVEGSDTRKNHYKWRARWDPYPKGFKSFFLSLSACV